MQHRICDFRNAKYQGQTIDKQPNGFGIILDQNYTFVIGQLISSTFIGPIAVIFDDSTKLYGDLFDQSNGVIVFADTVCRIFRNRNSVVIDYPSLKVLLKLEQIKVPSTPTKRNTVQQTKFRVANQKKYQQQNYIKYLSELLQLSAIPTKYLSYQNFIKQTFRVKYKNLLNFFESSKQFSLSFRQQGIYLKLAKKMDVVLSVGFNGSDKKPEIGRKYNYYRDYTNCLVQEFIQIQPSTLIQFDLWQKGCQQPNAILATAADLGIKVNKTNKLSKSVKQAQQLHNRTTQTKQKNRPKQCIKNLRQYYKRSLTFLNKYLNLSQIYSLKQQFEQYYNIINNIGHGKYAQTQLQNNGYKLDQSQQPIITRQTELRPYEASLTQWKKQIQRTVSVTRNKRPSTRTIYQDFTKSPSKNTIQNYQYRNSPQKVQPILQPKNNQKLFTPQKSSDKYINPQRNTQRQSFKNSRSKSRRQIKYLDSQTEDRYQRNIPSSSYNNSKNSYPNTKSDENSRRKSPMQYRYNYTNQMQSIKKQPQTDYKNQTKKTYRY